MQKTNASVIGSHFQDRNCPVCSSPRSEQIFEVPADPFFRQKYGILQARVGSCQGCGFCYTNPILSEELNDAQYCDPESGYNQMDKTSAEQAIWTDQLICYHELRSHLEAGAAVLDFGCGEGGLVYACQKGKFNAFGAELNQAAVARATKLGILNISSKPLSAFEDRSFDCVCCLHVFEHLPDCVPFVRQFRRLLKPGGWVFVMVPNYQSIKMRRNPGKYWGHPFQHMNAFSSGSLDRLFCGCGFRRVALKASWMTTPGLSNKVRVSMMVTKFAGNIFNFFPTKLLAAYQMTGN